MIFWNNNEFVSIRCLKKFKKRAIGNFQTIFDNAWMKPYKKTFSPHGEKVF